MMLVFVNRFVSGRTLDNLGVGNTTMFRVHMASRITLRYDNSSGEKRKILGAKNILACIVYSVLTTGTRSKMLWIAVG